MQAAEGPSEAGFTVAEVVVYCAVVASTAYLAFSSWHRFRTRHKLPWLLVSLLAMWFVIGIRRYRAGRRESAERALK